MSDLIKVTATDGFELGAYQAAGAEPTKGGLIVVQEIFGVNSHIQNVCDRFARHGYNVMAPALFDRIKPNVSNGYSDREIAEGRDLKARIDWDEALLDIQACLSHLKQAGDKVGIVGYCLGGLAAWLAAARLSDIDCAIGYYGGGTTEYLNEVPQCPIQLHFGELDSHIPLSDVDKIEAACPEAAIYRYPAAHGFDCNQRGSYHAQSAAMALDLTLKHLATHLSSEPG